MGGLPVVTIEQLQAIATPPEPPPANKKGQHSGSSFDVRAYLGKYGHEIVAERSHGTSTLYVLHQCVFDSSHADKEAAIGQTSAGVLFYQCFHNGCKGKTWHDARQIISGSDRLVEKSAAQGAGAQRIGERSA
jgi:hypothetical protein